MTALGCKTASFLLLLASVTVPSSAQCGSNCGYFNDWPAFAKISFNLDNCFAEDSWYLVLCRDDSTSNCEGLRELVRFSADEAGLQCNSNFTWVWTFTHSNSHFNSLSIDTSDPNQCDGSYALDFNNTSDDVSGDFEDAKVLCNNGDISAILSRDPGDSRSFILYYEARDLVYDFVPDGIPAETGEYCISMFDLMSKILTLLKSSNSAYDSLPSACAVEACDLVRLREPANFFPKCNRCI